MLALLHHPQFRRLCAAYFFASFAFEVPFTHLVRYALDEGAPRYRADLLTALFGVGGMSRVFLAFLSDKFGAQRVRGLSSRPF